MNSNLISSDIEFWSKQRVLLVGGAGFVGHHLALQISSLGATVSVLDSLQVNSLGHLISGHHTISGADLYIKFINQRLQLLHSNNVKLEVTDARDYHAVSRLIDQFNPTSIVHLAAVAHANRSNKDPFSTFDHSLRTLENVLDANKDLGARFIYLSSSMVYGDFSGKVAHEDQPCVPLGIYGSLKLAGELLVKSYQQVFGMEYVIVRPSALYGERCVSRRVGQAFIESALTTGQLSINGDGQDSLDFTYIEDLVDGLKSTIRQSKATNETFNLTFGNARSINELVSLVKKNFPSIELSNHQRDALMPERGTLSISKAQALLAYEPNYPLEIGFQKYIDWYLTFSTRRPEL